MNRRDFGAGLVAASLLPLATVARADVVELDAPAPVLKGTLLSGDPFDLADWRGKVVLVNFYSSYCRLCALEIGTLESAVEEYGRRGLVVLMLGVDRMEDKARVARMLGIYNLQGAMVDELTETGFQRRYPTPTTYLIDREGIVRQRMTGAKAPPRMHALLAPYFPQ